MRSYRPVPTYENYTRLPVSHDGFSFDFCCNLLYAECNRKDEFGYFINRLNAEKPDETFFGESTGGGLFCIPCVLTIRWGHTDVNYLFPSLHKVTEDTVDARSMLESQTRTRAGVCCCIGPSNVSNTHAFFSHTQDKKPVAGVVLPDSNEPFSAVPAVVMQ